MKNTEKIRQNMRRTRGALFMSMKSTGVVRAGAKDIKPVIFTFLLYSIGGWIAWDSDNFRFDFYIVLTITMMASLVLYMILRAKNWKIVLCDDTVIICGAFGKQKQFSRNSTRWIITVPFVSRINHIQLFDYTTGKRIANVPLDWINVNILFSLPHYGPMTQEEKNSYLYFVKQG